MKWNIVGLKNGYFLLLLPLFFVLHGYRENFGSVFLSEALSLLLEYVVASLLLTVFFVFVFKDWRKALLYTVLLTAFNFFFGAAHDAVKAWQPALFFVKYAFILPAAVLVFFALGRWLYRSQRSFNDTVRFLNFILVVLIAFDGALLFTKALHTTKSSAPLPFQVLPCTTCTKPNIYLIVADEYAGETELTEVLHYSDSSFSRALNQRDFHLNLRTTSNYNFTPFSMASMLSMNYLSGIEGYNSSKADMNVCYTTINRSPLWTFLQQQGYEIINHSIFNIADQHTAAIQSFLVMGKDLISGQTFLSRINRDIRYNLGEHFKIASEVKRFLSADKVNNETLLQDAYTTLNAKHGKPTFTYLHLTLPHYPYYFDSGGKENPVPDWKPEGRYNRKNYLSYLQYANRIYLQLIDAILAKNQVPPVIIFLGDHGFREFLEPVNHAYYFMNFSAVYLPGKQYGLYYDGMSNVNQLRVLLNTQFGQRLPLLKDSTSFLHE